MRRVATPALAAPALFAATALAGQTPADDCDMESFRMLSSRETVIGQRVTWVGSPEVACTDGVRIRADSAVVWEADERTEFYGGFRYSDSERELEADSADYFQGEGRLLAWGNAELRTLDGATVVRGDTLDLYEGTGGSGQERLEAAGRRAFALMAPADPDAGAEAAPYEVLADRLRFEGERFDCGDRRGWLMANVACALARPDFEEIGERLQALLDPAAGGIRTGGAE